MKDLDFRAMLDQLEGTHRLYKMSLGKQNKSRAWAVWLLMGGLLAICHRSISCQERRDDVGTFLLMRLAAEYSEQIRFFSDPQTKTEAIKDWWKVYSPLQYDNELGDIEYRLFSKNMKGKKADRYIHSSKRASPEGLDFSRDPNNEKLLDFLSLYSHPSQNLTRILFQSDKNDGSYSTYNYAGDDDFGNVAISNTETVLDIASRAVKIASHLYGPK